MNEIHCVCIRSIDLRSTEASSCRHRRFAASEIFPWTFNRINFITNPRNNSRASNSNTHNTSYMLVCNYKKCQQRINNKVSEISLWSLFNSRVNTEHIRHRWFGNLMLFESSTRRNGVRSGKLAWITQPVFGRQQDVRVSSLPSYSMPGSIGYSPTQWNGWLKEYQKKTESGPRSRLIAWFVDCIVLGLSC
jgi:hypothetical protein